ncbi:DGQHR domain-containing protein [Rhodomicrobium vannielii ATCC 17100]|uniref:DGQHR domain-containing protein DpdB n=1 Tax=Rhodomicrobium vannielii TaxID=1069 RepID=UPI00191A3C3A|nr:DGQHR domain-containing protein DpdB [Rhodomicrobium vannielii]MBJ7535391.1 DGQHR domain-containing protein [Rhodomicrobium vannielii ATCC 17100]
MKTLTYSAVQASQSPKHKVLTFAAKASDVLKFASIDRTKRNAQGELSGFQRPQIAGHIREIKDYLEQDDAVLPNPIVVAFTTGVSLEPTGDGIARLKINLAKGAPGLVVDGQQRLAALIQITGKDFEVFVSALICSDEAELRRQFVLINNTRPLPKSLIYELLPGVDGLPHRLSNRARASFLTARLNYDERSSLKGIIRQHTNPGGIISDTAIQRVIMNSLNDGIMRELIRRDCGEEKCFAIISEFYRAVQRVFPEAWRDHTPKTSRLVHGAGVIAMGYVMEVLALLDAAQTSEEFAKGLSALDGETAWTSGEWDFGQGDRRHWKAIQNVNRDIVMLAQFLIAIVRADLKGRRTARSENAYVNGGSRAETAR